MKRFLDITFSFLAIAFMAPLIILIIITLRFTGEREVFYMQKRIGRGGQSFGLYKFATMLRDSPNIGAGELTLENDSRVLFFGKFLRKTKLNEIPQLWNILIGEMSVVGPRPMVPNTYAFYSETARKKLDTIRPGLTGIGSVVFRNEERYLAGRDRPLEFYREHIIPYKSDLELWYVKNDSLWLYIKIILVTIVVVVFPSSNVVEKIFIGIPKLPKSLT